MRSIQRKEGTANLAAMSINKKAVFAAVTLAGALVLAGCSGEDTDQANEPEVEETVSQDEREQTPAEPEDDGATGESDKSTDTTDSESVLEGLAELEGLEGFEALEGLRGLEGLADLDAPDVTQAVDLPADFPSDVPLVEGTIFQVDHFGSGDFSMYYVSVNASGDAASVEAEAVQLLTDAGFELVEDPLLDFGSEFEGMSMATFEGSGDVNAVVVTIVEMQGLGYTMVGYSVDNSTWDF